jgi:dimethylaniline monooxygenase (N-oxide forming)
MDLTKVKGVGIIGAGVAGLSTAKMLLAEGLTCTVFERGSDLGGVWAAGYSNFSVQVQRELYEFPDWPLPGSGPEFTPGEMMRDYLEGYAKHFGVWPHIRFRATVEELRERSGGRPGWAIAYHQSGTIHYEEFDLW